MKTNFIIFLLFVSNVIYADHLDSNEFYRKGVLQQWVFGILILESDGIKEIDKKTVSTDLAASAFDFWYQKSNGSLKVDDNLSKMLYFHILAAMKNEHFKTRMNDPLSWGESARRIIGRPQYDWESERNQKAYDNLVQRFKRHFNELANQ